MKTLLYTALMILVLAGSADAYSVGWDAVTVNVDGTPTTDLAGYRLHMCAGNNTLNCASLQPCPDPTVNPTPIGCVIHFPTLVTGTVFTPSNQTEPRTWYLTSEDTTGNSSPASTLVFFPPPVINVAPGVPLNFHLIIQ